MNVASNIVSEALKKYAVTLPTSLHSVLYDGREKVMADSQVVQFSVTGNWAANINPSGHKTYITFR